MNNSKIVISNLSNDQIEDVKALESKLNSSNPNNQQVILIAYTNP